MEYDPLSRKTDMHDVDMGDWSYQYDAAGNLTRQTDARGCNTHFTYDQLNRLTGKTYSGSCSGTAVNYTYDSTSGGNEGKGRRTSMSIANVDMTSWIYDDRGRVTKETKVINGSGTFVTRWNYDAMDRVKWMKYPGGSGGQTGEQVNYTYDPQGLLESLAGTSTYVQSTNYDALGRVELRKLGNSRYTDYVYYSWGATNGMGRLKYIKTGTSPSYTSLQKMYYAYDAVGNVLTIKDYKAGGTQTQSFTYDALDRLKTARASGGSGGTYGQKNYSYNAIGNITNFEGMPYHYQDSNHKHAVTHLVGMSSSYRRYWYDANGNQTKRKVKAGSATYYQSFDAENRLTTVSGAASATFVYDGDGNRAKKIDGNGTTVYVGGHYEVEQNNSSTGRTLGVTLLNYGVACQDGASGSGYIMYSEESVHTRFSAHPPHGSNADHFVCVVYNGSWRYDSNTAYYTFTPRESDVLVAAANFTANTVTDLVGQDSTQNGIAYGYASGDLTFQANKWGGSYNDGEFYITGSGITMNGGQTIVRKYYYAGSTRIAVRKDGTLYWLLGDHLGSTALTAYPNGNKKAELRYYPWGETRYPNDTSGTPTSYRFTGQREDATIGLYFYNARFYDPALGRFISADTIVPSPGNPQSLNRYSYCLGNPVKYTDPTGLFSEEEIMDIYGVGTWEQALALFEMGGRLEGRWGWLGLLREARVGDIVDILEYADDGVGYWAGVFAKQDGEIFLKAMEGGWDSSLWPVERRFGDKLYSAYLPDQHGRAYNLHRDYGVGGVFLANKVYPVLKFDPSRVNGTDVVLDSIGTVASVVGANPVVEAYQSLKKAQNGARAIDGLLSTGGIAKGLLVDHDLRAAGLAFGGFAPFPAGTACNLAALYFDLEAGFYYAP
jgi:RHS repeat-associated protein